MAKAALEEKAFRVIPEYMVTQNRPYSVNDVYSNLHQEFGKVLVTKALEHGVTTGVLIEKAIGKQKLYYPDQTKLDQFDDSVLTDYDARIAALNEQHSKLAAENKTVQNELRTLEESKTTEELEEYVKVLEAKIFEMSARCTALESARGEATETESEGRRLAGLLEKADKESRKRKRIVMEIFGTIRENCPLSKNQLIENIGLDMD